MASPSALAGAPQASVSDDDVRLRRVVREYHDFVWRSLRRMGVAEAGTEDAAQQVFLVMANKLGNVSYDNERSFLFGVIVRVAADARRTLLRRREVNGEDLEETIDDTPSAEVLIDEKKARVILDAILQALPDDLRAVFVLCELEELDGPEVAEILEIPAGTVASRLRRARELFTAAATRWQRKTRTP